MSYDEPEPVVDFEGAEEHGHSLADYLSELDGYVHKDDSFRNEDGTYRRRNQKASADE